MIQPPICAADEDPVAENNAADSYEVEVDDEVRRVYPSQVKRRGQSSFAPIAEDAQRIDPRMFVPSPEALPMRRLVWRAIKRILNYWFPPDPPNIIAILRMPEKIYCARCGTVRVSKYCPSCGANIDRQFRKMVLKLSQYIVDGTESRRSEIARSVQEQIELRMAEMCEVQRNRMEKKLAALERNYVMQIARQKRYIRPIDPPALQRIAHHRDDDHIFDTRRGTRTLAD